MKKYKEILSEFEKQFQEEYDAAKAVNTDKIAKIGDWIDRYDGKPYGNERKGKSKMVWKLIKKQGETLISNITKPFINNYEIIEADPISDDDIYKAKINESLINYFFSKKFDKNTFIKTLTRVLVKEGTVFIKVGWNKIVDIDKQSIGKNPSQELIAKLVEKKYELVREKDGNVYAIKKNVKKNMPTAVICKNEDVFTDPKASSLADSNFLIYRYRASLSDLLQQPDVYPPSAVKKFKELIKTGTNENHELHIDGYESFNHEDEARKKITIYEYFGKYDINGDGIAEPVMAVFAESGSARQILKLRENPYPFKDIPFVAINLFNEEFDIWGKALADIIEDEQKLMTAIIRAIIDNMATATNGKTFIKAGSMDSKNLKRYLEGDPIIELNAADSIHNAIFQGGFNELPSSVYNMLNIIESNSESLTGINKMIQGLPGSEVKSPTNNFASIMTQSQIRLLDITNNITTGLRKMFVFWSKMCLEYMTDDEISRATGINITELKVKEANRLMREYNVDSLDPETAEGVRKIIVLEVDRMFDKKNFDMDVKIKVGTDGLKQNKISAINMLMQQAAPLVSAGIVDSSHIKDLLAEMAELLEFPSTAKKMREYKGPQPSEQDMQMMQIKLQQEQAKAEKDLALSKNALARTKLVEAKAKKEEQLLDASVSEKYLKVAKDATELKDQNENTVTEDMLKAMQDKGAYSNINEQQPNQNINQTEGVQQ